MTYDERREIEDYILILKKNAEWLTRSIENLEAALKKMPCVSKQKGEEDDEA